MLPQFDPVLLAEVNAWIHPPESSRPRIERPQWQATAERIIRETILECFGKPAWYIRRTLLNRVPFHRDQPAFKALWYQEHRLQLSLPPPDDVESDEQDFQPDDVPDQPAACETIGAEFETIAADSETIQALPETPAEKWVPRRPVRLVPPPDQWASTCRTIIAEVMEQFPKCRDPIKGEVNYPVIEFLKELRFRCPVSDELDDVPPEYIERLNEWREHCAGFRAAWCQQCSELMGFTLRTIRKPDPVPIPQLLPAGKTRDTKPVKKDLQRMLF
jgi:hypothetical protein